MTNFDQDMHMENVVIQLIRILYYPQSYDAQKVREEIHIRNLYGFF